MICVSSLDELAADGINRIVLSCGAYDGLHTGHQNILKTLHELADKHDATPVVLSFSPHPRKILTPNNALELIFSEEHKVKQLEDFGVKAVVLIPFTKAFSQIEAETFIASLFSIEGLDIKAMTVGEKWRFGRMAKGDINLLTNASKTYNFEFRPIKESMNGDIKISSSSIRQLLKAGDLEGVKELLGRHYSIYGEVIKGRGIAKEKYNYPTANLGSANEIFPPLGIYAAIAKLNGQSHEAIAYIGKAETDCLETPDRPFVEAHLFDFNENIYGQHLELELLRFIREDRKFNNEEALLKQIHDDIEAVQQFHQKMED